MSARPNWKGYLKLSLVTCGVAMFGASTASEKISFHTLNRDTGNRLRRRMVDEETGEMVESDDQVKGYEVSRGDYVILEDKEIEALAIDSTHTIDIERFVPRDEIDDIYIDTPYYLAPDGKVGLDAFAVIREAMREQKVAGLARVVMYRRERIVMLEPRGRGILATTLRYPYEVRDDGDYLGDIADVEVSDEMLQLATHIIKTKQGRFVPDKFEDRYEDALARLIEAKRAGKPLPRTKAAPKPRSVDLLEALKRSLSADGGNGAAKPARKAPAKRPAAAQRRKPAAGSRKATG